ncbi:MAG: sulfatase [Planctomycetales bacterium]
MFGSIALGCWAAVAVLRGMAFAAETSVAPADGSNADRPNIVVVLVDDLRWDELGCTGHPFVKTPHIDRVAREGALFRNAFAATPLCSPSRASFLTGLHAAAHGITDNTARNEQSRRLVTFPRLLHEAGYRTAFIGKWHMGNDADRRPGFDDWVCLIGQGSAIDPELNVNGEVRQARGYVTDLLTAQSLEFLDRGDDRPFCLYLSHKGLHPESRQADDGSVSNPLSSGRKFIPAERHRDLYADAEVPRRGNFARPPRGKPALERAIDDLPPLGAKTATDDDTIRDRLRMLAAIDEGLGRIFDRLERSGRLDRTLVVVASDHGYFYGEHGLSVERRLAYEESIRIPLLMRYPPLIKAGSRFDQFALSIDLAPTCLELAGVAVPPKMHGISLLPLLKGETDKTRPAVFIEYFSDTVFARVRSMGYRAVRTGRHKLIRYAELEGMDELYDLERDPFELENRIDDPALRPLLGELDHELARLRAESR